MRDRKWVLAGVAALVGIGLLFVAVGALRTPAEAEGEPIWNTIAEAPAAELTEPDYEAYAHLGKPPLPPEEALATFQIEEGFRIELVAHEPMVTDPVAMDIDPDGRLWVVNMPSYNMAPVRDILETTGERTEERERMLRERTPETPLGSVVVLEDTTGDGRMDVKRVFYEGLHLPRSIKVLRGGVLVSESPNVMTDTEEELDLWYIRDTTGDGRGDTRTSVSVEMTRTSSVQLGLTALKWGMDNWIHSSMAPSLRLEDGEWRKRPFERLGQWGMSQDDWGRLFSSSNSWPLESHLTPYGYSERHPEFNAESGKSERIAPMGPVWPAHAPGVNRGYRTGDVTREDGTLMRGAGIGGTAIYRGGQFGAEFRGDAFTPVGSGNLISRLIIDGDPGEIGLEADFAYEDRDFLTSTDERFRPVNAYNGPDGALYVLDMYRGLYDYVLWVTDFLRDHTLEHGLYEPTGQFGRIYRIVREDREIDYGPHRLSGDTPEELARRLTSEHGKQRDLAQQVLVQEAPPEAIDLLEDFIQDEGVEAYTRLHALWTLEGYDRETYPAERLTETALAALDDGHPRVRAAALRILEPALERNEDAVFERLEALAETETVPYVELQLTASLGASFDERATQLIAAILDARVDDPHFREMALTGVRYREARIAEVLRQDHEWSEERGGQYEALLASLAEAEEERPVGNLDHLTEAEQARYEAGAQQYPLCMACHGPNGQGIQGIGPALAGSEWVEGEPGPLTRIVLQGVDGAAAERDEEMPNMMPGQPYISNENIAAILTYIRQSWGNDAPPVTPEDVGQVRDETAGRHQPWSPDELRALSE